MGNSFSKLECAKAGKRPCIKLRRGQKNRQNVFRDRNAERCGPLRICGLPRCGRARSAHPHRGGRLYFSNFFFIELLANFVRPVLGCIDAKFLSKYLVLIVNTRLKAPGGSTRFTRFCTASYSKIRLNFVKHYRIFAFLHSKCCLFFASLDPKITIVDNIFPKFQQLILYGKPGKL